MLLPCGPPPTAVPAAPQPPTLTDVHKAPDVLDALSGAALGRLLLVLLGHLWCLAAHLAGTCEGAVHLSCKESEPASVRGHAKPALCAWGARHVAGGLRRPDGLTHGESMRSAPRRSKEGVLATGPAFVQTGRPLCSGGCRGRMGARVAQWSYGTPTSRRLGCNQRCSTGSLTVRSAAEHRARCSPQSPLVGWYLQDGAPVGRQADAILRLRDTGAGEAQLGIGAPTRTWKATILKGWAIESCAL
jgi:hypothetical protein